MKHLFFQLFKRFRIWLFLIVLLGSLIAINPTSDTDGVAIRAVLSDSPASLAGLTGPRANTLPRNLEVITAVDGMPILTLQDYYAAIDGLQPNDSLLIETDRSSYTVVISPRVIEHIVGYENVTINETTFEQPIINTTVIDNPGLGISVSPVPASNIRQGLDLQGGTRVLIEPETQLSEENFVFLKSNIDQRLNLFGLSDIKTTIVRDVPAAFGGQPRYLLIEIAGANIEEVKELVSNQGQFEARIANRTVFRGEKRDIRYVAHSPPEAGLGPQPCQNTGAEWICSYFFSVTLSAEAANQVADATRELAVVTSPSGNAQLSDPIEFYLDGKLTNSLTISPDLKGSVSTQIQITGFGTGSTEADAAQNAMADMKQIQTIIQTGSLPTRITIIKADEISPVLGKEFLANSAIVALVATLMVAIVVFAWYRRLIVSIPMMITALSEIIIVLGVAAVIGWQLDLPAIAGLVIIIGTSVDQQIIITDELLSRLGGKSVHVSKRMKNALFIITASFFTTFVAMLPLLFAGAGLLKNFAITTIIGIVIGVLITRPAYGTVLETILRAKEE